MSCQRLAVVRVDVDVDPVAGGWRVVVGRGEQNGEGLGAAVGAGAQDQAVTVQRGSAGFDTSPPPSGVTLPNAWADCSSSQPGTPHQNSPTTTPPQTLRTKCHQKCNHRRERATKHDHHAQR